MKKTKSSMVAFLLTFAISILATTSASAGTPDGITPNDEMVCDVLKADGTTKGLYGLCVAYCEATDSPNELTTEELIAALSKPSSRLLANYNKKRANAGNIDPQMPCATFHDETACPAWTLDEINTVGTRVLSASESVQYRVDDWQDSYDYGNYKIIMDREHLSNDDVSIENMVYAVKRGDTRFGVFADSYYDRATGTYLWFNYNSIPLDATQYDACAAEVRDHVMPTQIP